MSYVFNPFTGNFDAVSTATSTPGIIVATGTSNPVSGSTGELFYNTVDSTLYIWLGLWTAIGSGSSHTGSDLLLEDGTFLLLEDGTSTLQLEG